MNKSRLIWGIVCLAVAGALAVANLALPPEKVSFMVEGENRPWIPPAALGALGVALLVGAAVGGHGAAEPAEAAKVAQQPIIDEEKAALNKRLETIAWGCFLVMLGGFAFVPEQIIAGGFWSIGVGVIMLGLNAARYGYGLRMSGFTTFLGVAALISGVLEVLGLNALGGPILIIVLGLYLLVRPLFEKQQLFGKAEQA